MNQNPNLNRSWEESQTIIKNLEAQIAQLKEQLEAKSCQCHIIDPSKIRILLWINRSKSNKPETATLKIGEQRLLGLPRSDRRGESYWRFEELIEQTQKEIKCFNCSKEAKLNLIKCWECQVEMKIFGQLEESAPLVCGECKKKAEKAPKEAQKAKPQEPKTQREEEQMTQAMAENKKAQNHGETNNQTNDQVNNQSN